MESQWKTGPASSQAGASTDPCFQSDHRKFYLVFSQDTTNQNSEPNPATIPGTRMSLEKFDIQSTLANTETFCFERDGLGFEAKRLKAGGSFGVVQVTLRCHDQSVSVLPTRGMGIWEAQRQGVRFGWKSPVAGPIHPAWVPWTDPSGLGWLEGFDEMMVRCGLSNNGAPEFDAQGKMIWPLHGRIANLPAMATEVVLDPESDRIEIRGTVSETRFLFHHWQLETAISLSKDSPEIQIEDRVTNQSSQPGSMQLLYHCNFGPPLLQDRAQLLANVKKCVPRDPRAAEGWEHWNQIGPPEPGFREQVYFLEIEPDQNGWSSVVLTEPKRQLAAAVRYDAATLPCFTFWKNTAAPQDGYVVGLEPGTNFPNPRLVEAEAGRVVWLEGGESFHAKLAIGMYVGQAEVERLKLD